MMDEMLMKMMVQVRQKAIKTTWPSRMAKMAKAFNWNFRNKIKVLL